MTDYRLEWLKRKLLSLVDETDDQLFENMLNLNDKLLRNQMESFFDDEIENDEDVHLKVFFLYKTFYDKIVQEEILVPQEVIKTAPTKLSESETDSATPTPRVEKKKKKTKTSGKKERVSSPRDTPEDKRKGKAKKGLGTKKQILELESPRTDDEGFEESGTDAEGKEILASSPEVVEDQLGPEADSQNVAEEGGTEPEIEKTMDDLDGLPVMEESPPPTSPLTAEDLSTKTDAEEDKAVTDAKKKKGGAKEDVGIKKGSGKRKGTPKVKQKGRKSPRTLVELVTEPDQSVTEELEEQETEVSYVKKVVEKVIQAPMLNGFFGALLEDKVDPSQRYVYILRHSGEKIPFQDSWEEAVKVLPQHFIVGSTKGYFLASVKNFLHQVCVPLVNAQFRELMVSQLQLQQGSLVKKPGDVAELQSTSIAALYKPSDFYTLSLLIKRDEYRLPSATSDTGLQVATPMKSDLVNNIKKFLDSAE